MYQLIIVIHVLLGLGVIGLVLMQQGKGADAGAAFGTGSAGSVFGAQGAASFLSRSTAVLATLFFITSLGLAVINGHRGQSQDIMSTPSTDNNEKGLPDVEGAKAIDVPPPAAKTEEMPIVVPGQQPVAKQALPVTATDDKSVNDNTIPKAAVEVSKPITENKPLATENKPVVNETVKEIAPATVKQNAPAVVTEEVKPATVKENAPAAVEVKPAVEQDVVKENKPVAKKEVAKSNKTTSEKKAAKIKKAAKESTSNKQKAE